MEEQKETIEGAVNETANTPSSETASPNTEKTVLTDRIVIDDGTSPAQDADVTKLVSREAFPEADATRIVVRAPEPDTDETVVTTHEPNAYADATIIAPRETDTDADATVVAPSAPKDGAQDAPQDGVVTHRRDMLASLPSFDSEPGKRETPTDHSSDEAVVVTHTTRLDTPPLFEDEPQEEADDREQALSSLVTTTTQSVLPDEQETSIASAAAADPFPSTTISEGVQNYESPFAQQQVTTKGGTAKKVLKRVLIGLLALMGALVVIYIAVSLYFTSHFLPNTKVNGEDVSGMSVSDLSAYVSSIGESYKTKVTGDGLNLDINGKDINFVYDGSAYSNQAAEQINPWQWPLQINQSHEYIVDEAISYDQAKLDEIVGSAVDKANEGATQPTNATMAYDQGSQKFIVVADSLGTAVNRDAVLPAVSKGVTTMQKEITIGDEELVQPTIKKDNEKLLSSINTVNGMLEKPVVLRIADKDATTIDKNLMASWLYVDADSNITVNQEAIKEWAQGTLSSQFDTAGTKRSFTRPDGKQIEVEGGSPDYDYGWCIDGEELANVLADNLRHFNTNPLDVPMKKTAASWNPGGQDWPNRYIDVDLSEQHVRMYDDASNVIWESDCVSGNPIYNGGTDTGVFFIYTKASPMELVGLDYNGDGEPDYRSWVTYWMPFDGGEGLHDMTSRYAFGGNIYSYDGSHGCVNLPYSAAEQLWGLTEVGDCVVVHW